MDITQASPLWQMRAMNEPATEALNARLIDSLYTEAMLLADEARSYFDDAAREDRRTLDPMTRVRFSCESLKVTTRLMHIVAWLLARRALQSGEIPRAAHGSRSRRGWHELGTAADSDADAISSFPAGARTLIAASCDLYARVKRLEEGGAIEAVPSPARTLMSRLERSL